MKIRVWALVAAIAISVSSLLALARPAEALVGNCASLTDHYYSIVCVQSSYPYNGNSAKWSAAVPLNISQTAAAQGRFISEVVWAYDFTTPSNPRWLEAGDTAGGSGIIGHVNEWARIHYYTDGTRGSAFEKDYFYRYAPADGQQHEFTVQWIGSLWYVCFDGSCPTSFSTWTAPANMTTTREAGGLEIAGTPLSTSTTNSGTFQLNTMLLKNTSGQWLGWPAPLTQVDMPCGTVPCLQGYWATTTPPYDMWNNGQPTQ